MAIESLLLLVVCGAVLRVGPFTQWSSAVYPRCDVVRIAADRSEDRRGMPVSPIERTYSACPPPRRGVAVSLLLLPVVFPFGVGRALVTRGRASD